MAQKNISPCMAVGFLLNTWFVSEMAHLEEQYLKELMIKQKTQYNRQNMITRR